MEQEKELAIFQTAEGPGHNYQADMGEPIVNALLQ